MTQTTLRDYLQTTEDAISTGRVNDAMASCQYILTHFPEALEAQRLLGEVYLAQGKLAEAQQTFDWVLTNDPENVMAYCNRALISERTSDYDTALDCYQQAYELSRGNSQIRQIFNQLSEKAGQQGFIFSRAGLARLYMRGDLLSQAAQEWDAVLGTTPDRLDARTGLLETYWREGLYDQAEHLAREILQDIPHCLKALLLLAHVIFAQDALQAQDLMHQAEALDPDQVMAQELFSDFIARQPKDPFLKLLKKSSVMIPETSNGKHVAPTTATALENLSTQPDSTFAPDKSASTFSDQLVSWSSLDNLVDPQQDHQTLNDTAPFGNWADTNNSLSNFDSLNTFGQQDSLPSQPANTTQPTNVTPELDNWNDVGHLAEASTAKNSELETWQALPEPQSHDSVQGNGKAQAEQQPAWYHMDTFTTANPDPWSDTGNVEPATSSATWELENEDANHLPAPPAWLDMLTRSDHRQASRPEPPLSPALPEDAQDTLEPLGEQHEAHVAIQPIDNIDHEETATTAATVPPVETQTSLQEHIPDSSPSLESSDDEGFFFGPEWLKSLGATAIEPPFPHETEQAPSFAPTPTAEPVPSLQTDATDTKDSTDATNATVALERDESWSEPQLPTSNWSTPVREPQQPATEANHTAQPETQQKTTVKNWLEQATQRLNTSDQNLQTTLEELETELRSQGFKPLEPGALSALAQEPSLSSALAQFGNLEEHPVHEQQQAFQPELSSTTSPEEQQWMDFLEPVAPMTVEPVVSRPPEQTPVASHMDALSSLVSPHLENQTVTNRYSSAPVRQEHAPVAHQAAAAPSNTQPLSAVPNPQPNPNRAVEFELETTMKRPVVHVQPKRQSPLGQQPQGSPTGRSGEHTSTNNRANGTLNNRDRLIKGYQYQLAGSYDEAMQEYRFIIRNAPELLGEIVSNMRALLKIVPRYSAGYRVLGDAYMRQGEYLQAMEAYNKALNMAKKSKN